MTDSNVPIGRSGKLVRAAGWAMTWSVILSGLGPCVFARREMGTVVSAVVCWHLMSGLVVALVLALSWRRLRVSLTRDSNYLVGTTEGSLRLFSDAVIALLGLAALSGAVMLAVAALGQSVGRVSFLSVLHIACGSLVSIALGSRCVAVFRARARGIPAQVSPALALLLLSTAGLSAANYDAERYYRTLTATTSSQAGNSHFPSGAVLGSSSAWKSAQTPEQCGAAGCHPGAYSAWLKTSHARAASTTEYIAALKTAETKLGPDGDRWCDGCHSPTKLALEERSDSGDTQGQGGVGCLDCHSMSGVPELSGNGRAVYSAPAEYPFSRKHSGPGRTLHDLLLRVRPLPHSATLSGPGTVFDRAVSCAPCHTMSVSAAQNHYRFLRLDDTWQQWQSGPMSGQSLHTHQAPQIVKRDCVDCHSPHNSSRSRAEVTALASDLTVEVFALRRTGPSGGAEQIVAPLSVRPGVVNEGESVGLDVLVQNRSIGHDFPSGAHGMGNARLELIITDGRGQTRFHSASDGANPWTRQAGQINTDSPHRYGQLVLDRQATAIGAAESCEGVAPVYRNSIRPGESDVARYRLTVPSNTGGLLRISARLVRPDSRAKIVFLSQHSVTVGVRRGYGGPISPLLLTGRREDSVEPARFRAYGGALLNIGDLPGARRALLQAKGLAPNDPENWIALGRVSLDEGDLLSARLHLNHGLELNRGSPRAKAWLGRVYRLMGQYPAALDLLRPISLRYPGDRQTWFDLGLCLLSTGRYQEAIDSFNRILEVDPNDISAHYNLMQCYRRLRRIGEARREEGIYRVLRESEPPIQITEPYLRDHPDVLLESRRSHEHVLTLISDYGASAKQKGVAAH